MSEIGDEHPCERETDTAEKIHRYHEPPPFAERPVEGECADKPDACPDARNERLVVEAARQPFAPELLVALATATTVWEAHIPLYCEECPRIVETSEVNERNHRHGDEVTYPSFSPLLEVVMDFLRVPTEFALLEQIVCASMVPVVLENEVFPWQRDEISKAMRDVLLPPIRWESRSVHHIMTAINILDVQVGEGETK